MASRFIRTAWDTYKKNVKPIVGAQLVYVLAILAIVIVSVIPLVAAGAETILNGADYTPQDMVLLSAPLAIFFLGMMLAVVAAITMDTGRIGIYADALKGREVSVHNMLAITKDKFWTSLGSAVLVTAIVAMVGFAMLFFAAALSAINVLMTPMIVIIAVMAIVFFSLLFSITKQAIVIGNRAAFVSVEDSYNIVKRNYSKFLLIAVFVALLGILLTFADGLGTIAILFVLKPVADIAYTAFYMEKANKTEKAVAAIKENAAVWAAPKKLAAAKTQKRKGPGQRASKKARRKR